MARSSLLPYAFVGTVHLYEKNVKNFKRLLLWKKGKRKVLGVPQSQTTALLRPQEEEETDKSKQAQTEQTYEKH